MLLWWYSPAVVLVRRWLMYDWTVGVRTPWEGETESEDIRLQSRVVTTQHHHHDNFDWLHPLLACCPESAGNCLPSLCCSLYFGLLPHSYFHFICSKPESGRVSPGHNITTFANKTDKTFPSSPTQPTLVLFFSSLLANVKILFLTELKSNWL